MVTVCVVYNNAYKLYLPMFVEAIRYSYPDYKVWAVEVPMLGVKSYYSAVSRFLVNPSTESNTDYYYITDIDMIILPEETPLHEFHIEEMKSMRTVYSNTPRTKEFRGAERLTGLHFVNKNWYSITKSARYKAKKLLDDPRHGLGLNAIDDEIMLMSIVKSCNLPVKDPTSLIKRHHGIHLGTIRGKRNLQTINAGLKQRITFQRAYEYRKMMRNHSPFRDAVAYASAKDPNMKFMMKRIDVFTKRLTK